MMLSSRKLKHWLLPILLFILLSGQFFGDIERRELHPDENWYTRTAGTYFSLFVLKHNLDSHAWFRPTAWNHPMMGKYLMGGAIWLRGGDPLVKRMAGLPR